MRPDASTVSGLVTKRLWLTLLNGLSRVPVPVDLFTFQIEPPAPGTYSTPLASAGWNTGSQKSVASVPGAFQSVVNTHTGTSVPPLQVYFVSPHVCDAYEKISNGPCLVIM